VTSSGTSRTAIVFAAFLVGLLTLAAIFAPRLIDLRSLSPSITAELSRALGQDVRVRGDIFLSLIPRPQLMIRDIATKPYSGTQLALAAGEVRADLSWGDLILGRYAITNVTLRSAEIDGRWADLASVGEAVTQLSFERARLRLHVADPPLVFDGLDGAVSSTANGALTWMTSGVFESAPITMGGKLNAPSKGDGRYGQLTVKLPEADVTIELSGTMSSPEPQGVLAPSFKGRMNLSALHVVDALSLASFADFDLTRWPWSAQPLSISSDIEASAQRISISDTTLGLGDQTARLSGALELTPQPKFNLNAELTNIDAAQWFPTGPSGALQASIPSRASVLDALTQKPWAGAIKVNGTMLRLGDQVARDVTIDLAYDKSEWAIRNAAMTLPGQARVSVAGLWTSASEDAGFTGSWRGDIQDVRGFLSWFSVDSAAIPDGLLANFSASGLVQNNAKLTVLSDVALSFDAMQAKGRLAFGWDQAIPFAIDLDVDRLALDVYAPLIRQGIGAIIGLSPTSGPQASGYGVNPLAPWMGTLAAQRGLVRIAVPILTWRDLLAGPLGIDVAFGDGFVDVRSIAFTDASGAAVWVGGKIKNLDGVPTAESLQFDMKVSDVARFARATRTDIAAPLRAMAPWSMTGAINGSLLDATVALEGKLGPVDANARGKASVADRRLKLDLALDLSHPNANQVRDLAWPGLKFKTKLDGSMTVAAKLKLDGAKLAVNDIAATIGRYGLRGQMDVDQSTQPRSVSATFSNINIDFTALTPLPIFPLPAPGGWRGEVTLSGPHIRSSILDAENFTARFVAVSDSVELAEWQGKLFGGQCQVGLKWSKAPDATTSENAQHLQGQLVLNGADPSLMFDGLTTTSKAQADLSLSFATSAAKPNGWLKALSGTGTARLSLPANAPLKASGLFAPLAAVAQAEGPGGQVPTKQESTASFTIDSGVATLKDLRIQSNAYSAMFDGAVDLNRQTFDLKGTLKLRDRGLIVGPSAQLVLPPTAPMTITGPIAAPTIKLDVSRAQR